jgi:hypothetical protein
MTDKMPVGEWIEVRDTRLGYNEWVVVRVVFVSKDITIVELRNGKEYAVFNNTEWRYPTNPIKELREKMLDEWRSQGVDYAYDDDHSVACIGQYFDWLIKNGYIEVK